jgi:hypothetical protein
MLGADDSKYEVPPNFEAEVILKWMIYEGLVRRDDYLDPR